MERFRPNVCAVVTDASRSRVLVFRRVDWRNTRHRWQFPQGGLEAGEAPEAGLLRELAEEIGTADVEVLDRLAQPISYRFPPEVLARQRDHSQLKGYQGQKQHWFLVRLRGGSATIHFEHQPAEFDAFRWVSPRRVLVLVMPFKQAAYQQGLLGLGLLPPG